MSSWLWDLWQWLGNPTITPWGGGIAALVASISVATRWWLADPKRLPGRAVAVIGIWLITAGFLQFVTSADGGAQGDGGGDGATSTGRSNGHVQSQPASDQTRALQSPSPSKGNPPLLGNNVAAHIAFLPSPANRHRAKDYACQITFVARDGTQTRQLCGDDMDQFLDRLKTTLGELHLPERPDDRPWYIDVHITPSPGNNALERIKATIRESQANLVIRYGDTSIDQDNNGHERP